MFEEEVILADLLSYTNSEVLEPVTYARNSYLHLRLSPRDASKKTEIHDVTSVTDIDGYLNLHRHTFYEIVPETDDLVSFAGYHRLLLSH